MLALSGCSTEQIDATPSGRAASCIDPAFAPMSFIAASSNDVGLAEGPLLALQATGRSELVGNARR